MEYIRAPSSNTAVFLQMMRTQKVKVSTVKVSKPKVTVPKPKVLPKPQIKVSKGSLGKTSGLPEIQQINHFLTAGVDRSANNELNKIRENIIANMPNYNETYFNDLEYGANWKNIHAKFMSKMPLLCAEPYTKIAIEQMGGMAFNYDFKLSFLNEVNTEVKEVKLEFKHNNDNVSELTQFLELYDKDCKEKYNICSILYTEFYYDNYLDKYLACDDEITESKPAKEIYLKNVYDIKYKHPFFKHLYDKKNNKTKEKREIANESFVDYLTRYSSSFKFDKIAEKIKESQKDKCFLLWDCENFHVKKLDNVENINIVGIKENTMKGACFDIIVENFQYDIRVRLNYGNNLGLCNPRWKFTFINK